MNKTELILSTAGVFEEGKDIKIDVIETGLKEDLALLAISYLAELTTTEETTLEAIVQTELFAKTLDILSVEMNVATERDEVKEAESFKGLLKDFFELFELIGLNKCNCGKEEGIKKDEE